MQGVLRDRLKTALSEVLEEMFYLVPDELEGGSKEPKGGYLAEIALNGPRRLTLQILIPEKLAEEMAANFLPGEDVTPAMVRDVLRELANMVGGALLRLLEGDWYVGLPEVYEGVEAMGVVLGRTPLCEFDIEGESLYLYVEAN